MIFSRQTSAIALLSLTSACAASAPDSAERQDDVIVQPTGGSAKLTLTVPEGSAAAQLWAEREDHGAPALLLEPGVAVTVSPGAYCLWTKIGTFKTKMNCGLQIASGANLTYALGGVRFTRSTTDLVFGIDWPTSELSTVKDFLRRTDLLPHAPGSFRYDHLSGGEIDWYAFTVRPGQVTSVDLTSRYGRVAGRLLPSAAADRALPTHPNREGEKTFGAEVTLRITGGTVRSIRGRELLVALDAPVLFRAVVATGEQASVAFRYSSGAAGTQLLTLGLGDSSLQLGRLDVDKVAVTMPDGSVSQVAGRFSVSRDGTILERELALGHGIDLLPGAYRVDVSYEHPVDGAPFTANYLANVR